MADDLSALDVPAHPRSTSFAATPHLDRLAAEGMLFETCYATPLCTPSRVELLTGQYGFRTGWYNFIGRAYTPRPDSPRHDIGLNITFADILRNAGYATAVAGKWQLTGDIPDLVHDCGFDEYLIWQWLHKLPDGVEHTGAWQSESRAVPERFWHPSLISNGKYVPTSPTDYGPDQFTDFLIHFMRRNRNRPFLAYYPMVLTHTPWRPTPDWRVTGRHRPGGFETNLEYLDHLVGRLVREVDRLGLRENTIIIFTADNGTQGRGKGSIEQGGMHVPLIMRCPGTIEHGVYSDALTDFTDLLPTLTAFAGAALPADRRFDGTSLAPVLRSEQMHHREWIFTFLADERLLLTDSLTLDSQGLPYRIDVDTNDVDVPDRTSLEHQRLMSIFERLPGPEHEDDLILPESPDSDEDENE